MYLLIGRASQYSFLELLFAKHEKPYSTVWHYKFALGVLIYRRISPRTFDLHYRCCSAPKVPTETVHEDRELDTKHTYV